MKILILDPVHETLTQGLKENGFTLVEDFYSDLDALDFSCEGIIIRSRMKLTKAVISRFEKLKFIARPGAGLENIDTEYAKSEGVKVFRSPEGNCQAVAEHALGMLLNLMNNIHRADNEVRRGIWKRKENRGNELSEKTVGLIGYGVMGKAFAKMLSGIGCKVVFYDILPNLGDKYATQLSMEQLKKVSDVVSLHIPLTPETKKLVNDQWLAGFEKSIYFINTARGECVDTKALINALNDNKVKAAGLDVLEFEAHSFEQADLLNNPTFKELVEHPNVLLTPHIAGWTHESNRKMSTVLLEEILGNFSLD